jgi:phospholipid/cholesterol/gamma-HCH transport system substrate-binding protein
MERRPIRDFIVGLFVLAGLLALAWLSLSVGGVTLNKKGGLTLHAEFDQTGGLKVRGAVVIAGVKVGEVTAIRPTQGLMARVDLDIDPDIKLPNDSSAAILTEGVLGDRYIAIEPGGADQIFKSGDQITHTEAAILLERALSKFGSSLTGGTAYNRPGALRVYALFDETGGIKPRAAVAIGGVKVGEVVGTSLDKNFRVRVDMVLDPKLKLPEDSFASVFTEGLIGDHYIALSPGGSDTDLKSGEAITHTESAMVLERLMGKLVYGLTKGDDADKDADKKHATTAPSP